MRIEIISQDLFVSREQPVLRCLPQITSLVYISVCHREARMSAVLNIPFGIVFTDMEAELLVRWL